MRRITAANAGPFTFAGTNSYLIGDSRVAIVDPGPADEAHLHALLAATDGATVTHILLTHAHHDHVDGVARLVAATGARTYGGARKPAPSATVDAPATDAGAAPAFAPDEVIADGAAIGGKGWQVEAIATPGHASEHFAFALTGTDMLFSGDHVMGWSTTVVAPPDGDMADYMRSLDKLLARREDTYLPGHGAPLPHAHDYVRGLKQHRQEREAAILARLAAGDRTIPAIVAAVYAGLAPALAGAAGLSVQAHLQDLEERGLVERDGPPGPAGAYRLSRR